MKPNESQVDDFFSKLPDEDKEEANIFEETKPEEVKSPVVDEDDPEKAPESVKDRRHRRLEAKLQQERESNIALNARLQAVSEMDKFAKESGDIVIPDIAKMFDSSDVGKENALRLSKVISDIKQNAKEETLKEIKQERERELASQKEYETFIDNELESLEDEFSVDLTSNSPKARKARTEFLEMVQDLSPKDEDGNIISYADFGSTFDVYKKTKTEDKENTTRRDEIASRSMRRSSSGTETIKPRTPGFGGWKQDYGV